MTDEPKKPLPDTIKSLLSPPEVVTTSYTLPDPLPIYGQNVIAHLARDHGWRVAGEIKMTTLDVSVTLRKGDEVRRLFVTVDDAENRTVLECVSTFLGAKT